MSGISTLTYLILRQKTNLFLKMLFRIPEPKLMFDEYFKQSTFFFFLLYLPKHAKYAIKMTEKVLQLYCRWSFIVCDPVVVAVFYPAALFSLKPTSFSVHPFIFEIPSIFGSSVFSFVSLQRSAGRWSPVTSAQCLKEVSPNSTTSLNTPRSPSTTPASP